MIASVVGDLTHFRPVGGRLSPSGTGKLLAPGIIHIGAIDLVDGKGGFQCLGDTSLPVPLDCMAQGKFDGMGNQFEVVLKAVFHLALKRMYTP